MIRQTDASEAALINALRQAAVERKGGDNGLTINEISAAAEMSVRAVRDRIRAMLVDSPPVVIAGRAQRKDISGRMMTVPVYRIATREERDQ